MAHTVYILVLNIDIKLKFLVRFFSINLFNFNYYRHHSLVLVVCLWWTQYEIKSFLGIIFWLHTTSRNIHWLHQEIMHISWKSEFNMPQGCGGKWTTYRWETNNIILWHHGWWENLGLAINWSYSKLFLYFL